MYALPWGLWVFLAGTTVWTIAEITAGPTMFSYPGRVAPDALRGRYIASMQTMFNLGATVGPALGVAVYRAVGSQVWIWCALASGLGLALALLGMHQPDMAAARPLATEPVEAAGELTDLASLAGDK